MKPITRKEKFLAKAAGESVEIPEPITREEYYLKKIAENGGGGSGANVEGNTTAEPNQPVLSSLKIDNKVFPVDNFISSVPINGKTPYLLRTTAGGNDVGGKKKAKSIVGATVAWNQQVGTMTSSAEVYGVTRTAVDDGKGLKYTVSNCSQNTSYTATYVPNLTASNHVFFVSLGNVELPTGCRLSLVSTDRATNFLGRSASPNIGVAISVGVTAEFTVYPQAFDLTLMFGSTIADYANTLETATAGSGIAWLKSYGFFTKDYYPYNAGELLSVKTSANVMTGFNLYDNTTGKAILIGGEPCQITGTYTSFTYVDFSGNIVPLFPDSDGYFTPTTDGELTITGGNATDTCVHFVYDGERDGEYEAYVKHIYALDSDLELRGLYKLDANNNIYADGDKYEPDGTVTRNYGVYTFTGNEQWIQYADTSDWYTTAIEYADYSGASYTSGLFICSSTLTPQPSQGGGYYSTKGDAWLQASTTIYKRFHVCNPDAASSADMQNYTRGITVVYKLATPTTESADSYDEEMIIDDWGTEEYVDNRTVALPVGHDTDYEVNLKAKLEMTPNSPDTDGLYLVQHINGVNKYIQYVSPVPDLPSSNGTYTLKVTVSGSTKTVSWVSG